MAFKIAQTPAFNWPVKIPVPADGGKVLEEEVTIRFKRLTVDEITQTYESTGKDMRKLSRAIVIGWNGVEDDDGTAVPFNATHLDALLNIPGAAAAIVTAWMDANAGARQKN